MMISYTINEAQNNLCRLIDQTAQSHQPITIVGNTTNAVLISSEDWNAVQETLYLLNIPSVRESIQTGMAEPISSCVKELDW